MYGFRYGYRGRQRGVRGWGAVEPLFALGEQGLWLDPSDLSTLFQDTAGTIPVTAPGQTVALGRDKSGRGNHLIQPVALSRPTLGRHPVGGRRNLARYTDCVGAAWTAAGTTPPTWVATTRFGKPCMAVTFPNGLTDAGYAGSRVTYNGGAFSASIPNTFSARYVVSTSRPLAAGEYFTLQHNGAFGTSAINVVTANEGLAPTEWKVFNFTGSSATVATGNIFPVVYAGTTNNGPLTVYLTEVQWEIGTTTPYQKVTSDWDVTEAGKADCWYLSFDGVDDFMVSAAPIDFSSASAISVFAGVYRENTGVALIAELTANANSTSGGFFLAGAASGSDYGLSHNRSTVSQIALAPFGTSPEYAVLAGSTGPSQRSRLRFNGTPYSAINLSNADAYVNATLWVGRRGGTTLPFKGRIYQLPIRGADTPDAQAAAVEAQIETKMGATL